MQKIVIMRFGPPTPIMEINAALKPHFADEKAKAFPMPGGVMSVFNTESSIEEVTASIKETGVPVPFFIFPFNANACQLPQPVIDAIGADTVNETSAPARTLTMDEILEKISTHGIASLTPEEKAVLNAGT